MKKILSAVLAAAMVLSMGVMAFAASTADTSFGSGSSGVNHNNVNVKQNLEFKAVYHKENGAYQQYNAAQDVQDLRAGDELYFRVDWDTANNAPGNPFAGKADEDWVIKINNAQFVGAAEFFYDANKGIDPAGAYLFVKVTLENDFDAYEEDEVNFYFYIYDGENKVKSDKVAVSYNFINYTKETLTKDDLNWVITVDRPTTYTYKKGEKAAKATINFNDDLALAEFKMYPNEKYTLSAEEKYSKDLSKEYDTDVDTINFRMKNVENVDIVFPASKDNKQVVAVVDGELVPVDAEYVKGYKFESGEVVSGYLVASAEYTSYAVIDADIEIDVEDDVDVDGETPTVDNGDKTNPPMGANDFVGAAVALAVVSVAAAGALALKK